MRAGSSWNGFPGTTEDFSITSFRLQVFLTFYHIDVMDMVQQYRVSFSVLRHTTGQTGQLSSLQVVILSFYRGTVKKMSFFLLFPH